MEKLVFSANGTGITGYPHVKELKWTFASNCTLTYIYIYIYKGLNYKTLKRNIGINIYCLGSGNGFLDMTTKAGATK